MSHTVEILSVGTELLLGNIANTDAQMLSQGLSELGLNVFWHTVVGDNLQRAEEAVALAKQRADIIITTGGLGPTCDDLTKNVLAEAFGKKLVFDEGSAQRIRSYFQRTGRPMTDNNLQQAMLPEGCTILENDWGTAPGCAFEAEGCHVIMLPGPPSECRPMFQYRAKPYLLSLSVPIAAMTPVNSERMKMQAGVFLFFDVRSKPEEKAGELSYEDYDLSNIQQKYFQVVSDEAKRRGDIPAPKPFLYKIILNRHNWKDFSKYVRAIGIRKYKMYPEIDKLARDITEQAFDGNPGRN